MLQLSRQFLTVQSLLRLCARSMGKMDQFKWKPHKVKPNRKPKLEVIMKEHMESLGNKGQLVQVERGYARNFLVPQGKAAYATRENIKKFLITDQQAAREAEENPKAQVSSKFMRYLNRTRLTVERNEDAKFYITAHQLALEFKRQKQLHVPAHRIHLNETITSFGDYIVDLEVRDNVLVKMKVTVTPWEPRIASRFRAVLNPGAEPSGGGEQSRTGASN